MSKPVKGHFDSLRGPIPCEMMTCWSDVSVRSIRCNLRITAKHNTGPYAPGEVIETDALRFVQVFGQYGTSCTTIPIGDAMGLPVPTARSIKPGPRYVPSPYQLIGHVR